MTYLVVGFQKICLKHRINKLKLRFLITENMYWLGGILITTQIIGWIFNKWLDDVFAN